MNIFYDAFCGTLHGKDTGVKETSGSVCPAIPKLFGNTRYVFTLPLESLTITEVENSPFESEIFFTASPNGITVAFPSTLDVAGEIAFDAGCRYLLRIRSNVAFLSEISNAAEDASYSATPHNLTSNTSDPRFTLSSSSDKYEDIYDEESGTYDYVLHQAWNAMDADSSNLAQSTSDEYSCWWKICFNEGLVNPTGLERRHILFFENIFTREAWLGGICHEPDGNWMAQIARNQTDAWDGKLKDMAYLIHDRDPLFQERFTDILASAGCKTKMTQPRCPEQNGFIESFIKTFKTECLDHLLLSTEEQLRYVVNQFLEFYNRERPHSGLDGRMINPWPQDADGEITEFSRLGGLLKSYRRVKTAA